MTDTTELGRRTTMTASLVLAKELDRDNHCGGDKYPELVHIRTQHWDERRWENVWLDVYMHPATDTYAGVLFNTAATECQDSDTNAEIVDVEPDPTPYYRLKRSTK